MENVEEDVWKTEKKSWKEKEEWDKGKNPFTVIFSKQKEWTEVEFELFCQILNGKQRVGNAEDEARERVDL